MQGELWDKEIEGRMIGSRQMKPENFGNVVDVAKNIKNLSPQILLIPG